MVFVRPGLLWLLLLALPLVVLHFDRRRMGLRSVRATLVAVLRTLAFVLLVLAAARPVLQQADPVRTTVAVVDVSASMSDTDLSKVQAALDQLVARQAAEESIELVSFDAQARWVGTCRAGAKRGERLTLPVRTAPPPGSALADALALAGALVPDAGRGRVVLYTDGLETTGDGLAVATRLAERGIGVETQAIGTPRAKEVILRSAALPDTAGLGATVELRAEVESAEESAASFVVRAAEGGDEMVTPVRLRPGRQPVTCRIPLHREGLCRYTVRIESAADTLSENNALDVAVQVLPARTVRVVEDTADAPAAAALASLLGEAAHVMRLPPQELAAPGSLEAVDLLVVADTPAEALDVAVQERIRQAVVGGMGLLATGGRRAFGPGGYAHTPLAGVLPLRFVQNIERRDPSTTLVIIIDTSGSMGGPRVALAKEIARLAIGRLKPHDKAGVVEFYGSKRWAAPIQPASNAIDLQRALNRLSAGGGTVILPAIEEAYYALQNVTTRTKHVLVLTDGGVEPGAFEPLVRKMADKGITLSTVLVGPGGHSAFLASLAQWGRGRAYSAPDRFNLPEVIVKQPESSMLTPFVERPSTLIAKQKGAVLDGVAVADAPLLSGYVETEGRPTADLILESDLGHPLLAQWRYGLGAVAVLTTQLGGEWSSELARWPDYARLVSNLARALYPVSADEALRIQPRPRPGALELQIDNALAQTPAAFAEVELTLTDATGAAHTWTLEPIRPEEWNLRISRPAPGTYGLTARTRDGRLAGSAAYSVPAEREVGSLGPDTGLCDAIGALQQQAAERAAALAGHLRRPFEIWPVLVAVALSLFLLQVLVRRWPDRSTPGVLARGTLGLVLLGGLWATPAARAETPPSPEVPASQSVLPADILAAVQSALQQSDRAEADLSFAAVCQRVLQQDGRLDRLIAHLQQQGAEPARARWFLAAAALNNGDLAVAQQALADLATRADAGPEVFGELARVEELAGNDAAALSALERAAAHETEADRRFALRVRQALLLYDGADRAAGSQALRSAVSERPGAGPFCAYLAALNGDDALAVELLQPNGEPKARFHHHQFRGLFLLRLKRPAEAQAEFQQAYDIATLPRDRRYALERLIAAARQADGLAALADQWQAHPQLPVDQLSALVAVLREIGRADDALAVVRRPAQTPEQRELIESPDFQREIIAAAVEAGKEAQAEAAYRALVEREPQRVEFRAGLARLLLLADRRDDAVQLFRDATQRLDDPRMLFELADAARGLGLDEPALAAAQEAGRRNASFHTRAVLFEADLAHLRGDADRALALLRDLATALGDDLPQLLPVAETFERYGDRAEALRLFSRLYAASKGEDALLRLAWLLEENQRFEQAFDLWKELWETTATPARVAQAQERMLDLAARTGRLADLAITLEEQLDAGTGSARHRALLVDIYTRSNDPVSAAEVLQDSARRGGDEVRALQELAKVYLACEQFGRCHATLQRLVKLDPSNAADYLQQMAIVALERRQPQDARVALDQLTALPGAGEGVDELAAGVLDLLDLHAEAAGSYRRVVARHPDRIEAYLLWANAMRDAGQAEQAITRLQGLVEEAAEDDLFAVAVDGLLNLDAKPVVLRSALRRVYTRIAAEPDKVYLYNLAVDLLEAIGQVAPARTVLEQAVIVAGERRVQLLRELMDGARADGQFDRVIMYGRSLAALGEQVPPQVYLDLGEAMIKAGQLSSAERVFERAGLEDDVSTIQQRVAGYYDEAGMPAAAERLIRQLLVAQPDNVALLIRAGGLNEQVGDDARAYEQYDRAVDLMLRRLPAVVRPDEVAASAPAEAKPKRGRPAAGTNLDELTQYFESAGYGLLNAARTPELQERLLRELPALARQELDARIADRLLAPALERNPRLAHLVPFVRHVAFALHVPEVADQFDRELLERYPRDAALRRDVVQVRIEWGLFAQAAAFATLTDCDTPRPPDLVVEELCADAQKLNGALAGSGLDEAVARRLVPLLILRGRDDDARRALRATRVGAAATTDDLATVMLTGAIALNDHEALQLWLNRWLDSRAQRREGKSIGESLLRCLRLGWNQLTPEERPALLERIARWSATLEGDARVQVDFLRWRLAKASGAAFDEPERFYDDAARSTALSLDELAELLEALPADGRPGFVQTLVAARKPAEARRFILELVGKLTFPVDAAVTDALVTGFKAAPQAKLRRDRAYVDVQVGDWNRNPAQPDLGRRIGEILLSDLPNEVTVLAAVAIARHNAGAQAEARVLATEAVDTLLAAKQPDVDTARLWDDVASLLEPDDLAKLIADLRDRREVEGPTPALHYGEGVLLETAGRTSEALTAYQAAFALAPGNRVLSRKIIRFLQDAGRSADLAQLLSANLTKSTVMESFEWRTLVQAYCDIYDPVAAAAAVKKLEGPLGAAHAMYVARLMDRRDEVRTAFRRFLIANRNDARFYSPFWPDDPPVGGMADFLTKRVPRQRITMFTALADEPFAEADLQSMLLAAPPDRRDVPGFVDGLVKATKLNGTRAGLYAALSQIQQRGVLNAKDDRLIVALAKDDPAALPAALAEGLSGFLAYLDVSSADGALLLDQMARFERLRGQGSAAGNTLRWQVAADLQPGRSATWIDERLERLDAYLAQLPEAERRPAHRRLLGHLAPTPLDPLSDTLDAALVERWAGAGDAEELERQLVAYRGLLQARAPSERFPALCTALAACYARADRLDDFTAMVERALTPPKGYWVNLAPPDCARMLPPAAALADPARYVEALAATIERRRAAGTLDARSATQCLCLVGQWCAENQRADEARALLGRATQTAGDLGGHWLWIADLARTAGADERALDAEARLLEARMLPIARVPRLLQGIEAAKGQPAADRLALAAASYSSHPEVLTRALRLARTAGDAAAAADYARRLQAVAASQPAVPTPK
jgi:predicted Zn-dependent protease